MEAIGKHRTMPRLAATAAWWPLFVLPAMIIVGGRGLPAWVAMWLLAMAVYAGCKVLTLRSLIAAERPAENWRIAGYLLAWPGMDPRPFVTPAGEHSRQETAGWGAAVLVALLGAVMFWGLPHVFSPTSDWLTAWCGMSGVVLMLHFGLFAILAAAWQRAGVPVDRLMRAPLSAISLSDFWSNRWNRGFRDLTQAIVFLPLLKRYGKLPALWGVFIVSGLLHDLVISVPAGAGYGRPTLYFAIQALGVIVERSATGRRAGLRRGMQGRLFAAVLVVTPLPLLFHGAFIDNVVLEMMRAWGALA